MSDKKIIGVLALQGAVEPHKNHIEACGAEYRPVKTAAQIESVDALILPGGESTTMLKLIENFGLWETLFSTFQSKPTWGICAGSILLAEKVVNPEQRAFAMLPIRIERNGYGRQLDSHHAEIDGYTVSFIRAPVIESLKGDLDVLAEHDGTPVWVKKGHVMATTFHPELTMEYPSPMHKYFIETLCKEPWAGSNCSSIGGKQ